MAYLYHQVFYRPLFNALIFLYQTLAGHDLGLAIIFLTIVIRALLYPLFQRSARYQTVVQQIQPQLKKIQEEYKNDKERQVRETMAVYREHHINPFSGFLFLLIQLPILIALFQILHHIDMGVGSELYSFISSPQYLNTTFFGLIDLKKSSILLVFLAAIGQYIQGKLGLPKRTKGEESSVADQMARQMVFIGPVVTLILFLQFPAAVTLYWCLSSLFSIAQQLLINRQLRYGKLGSIH